MFKKLVITSAIASTLFVTGVSAQTSTPITGNIESKCVIVTDTVGVYGNPSTDKLSTESSAGGVSPVIRFDIIEASSYKGIVITPMDFDVSPVLNDVVNWTGNAEVVEMSDAQMSVFETSKVQYENVTEFDFSIAGSAWVKATSIAEFGYGKSFPGGTYRASVEAECIAQ